MCSRIFDPVLQTLCVNDGMKGGTPSILYDLGLGLDKLYSEPIDGVPEPVFSSSWTKHSASFNNEE
jgi:hypothetical protein